MKDKMLLKKCLKIEKDYRFKNTGKIEFDNSERQIIDSRLFPDWWFYSSDFEFKIGLLVKAINNNELLTEMEEVLVINRHNTMKKMINNMIEDA